jgi:hypothetical protein
MCIHKNEITRTLLISNYHNYILNTIAIYSTWSLLCDTLILKLYIKTFYEPTDMNVFM